ncbi:MAG: AAA family ATPase, partial [Candidatus Magnetoovum sp. WYHC-5]|nr:AAA family ATPase [Candidatus Magnetoovum sp. WYHC-5]
IIDHLECNMRSEKKEKRKIGAQIKNNISDFYNFLFSIDYIVPKYELKYGEDGNTELSKLSPGEKGALLLTFYLLIDRDDIPIIIDQPEDNLDNQTVYKLLVKYIKLAKKRRQIIIVTHNPNLAVVCDAEQIIYTKIYKANKNAVYYITGSIENPTMNEHIINILEGTMPAFKNRDAKYLKN